MINIIFLLPINIREKKRKREKERKSYEIQLNDYQSAKCLDLLRNSQLILKENMDTEVSLENFYVDTGSYKGLNQEFTALPNFLLVLKVFLAFFFLRL